MSSAIRTWVNGEPCRLDRATTVRRLVGDRIGSEKGIAVAVNGEVVPRSTWGERALDDGDRVELLTAAQGG